MTFRETLDRHLHAIRDRDLEGLLETVSSEDLTLIMADGRLVRSKAEFADAHKGWFAEKSWSLEVDVVNLIESPTVGLAVLHLDYRDDHASRPPVHQKSYLSLVFALHGQQWLMVHDQNTPIQSAVAAAP